MLKVAESGIQTTCEVDIMMQSVAVTNLLIKVCMELITLLVEGEDSGSELLDFAILRTKLIPHCLYIAL